MSGGHFDYRQHVLRDIADSIEDVILKNGNTEKNQWGEPGGYGFSATTIEQLSHAVKALRIAEVYAQRADWLLSGDDGEESFIRRLADDLENLK